MFLTNLFKIKRKCTHDKIAPNIDLAYCPDCGKLIKNEWFITRCACCGVKLKTICKNNKVMPINHFCSNCGHNDYIIEKNDKINFIDINYAVLIKQECENIIPSSTTQCWQEKINEQPKLLVQYL